MAKMIWIQRLTPASIDWSKRSVCLEFGMFVFRTALVVGWQPTHLCCNLCRRLFCLGLINLRFTLKLLKFRL